MTVITTGRRHPVRVALLALTLGLAGVVGGCSSGDGDSSDALSPAAGAAASKGAVPDGAAPAAVAAGSPGRAGAPAEEDDTRGAPGRPTKDGRQVDVFRRVPGSAGDACVAVGDRRDVRSGGFVAGPFDDARSRYGAAEPGRTKREVRLYWVPMHARRMPGLEVAVTNVGTGERRTFSQATVADADQWMFYDSTIRIDTPGEWRFEVRSGRDRGCFRVDFG